MFVKCIVMKLQMKEYADDDLFLFVLEIFYLKIEQ